MNHRKSLRTLSHRLKIMQKGTKSTRCEHWNFAGRDVWAHQQCLLQWNWTTVTAVHHFIWRHLYASVQAAQTPASKLRFVTPDKESNMSTLWQGEEFEQICSRELLTEKAADIEKTIAVKEHERERYDFDPTMFYENRLRNRRPDGIEINKNHRTLYILEFKRSSERNEDFLRVKEKG